VPHAVLEQLAAGLRNDLASVGDHQHAPEPCDLALDQLAEDDGFARAGRPDGQNSIARRERVEGSHVVDLIGPQHGRYGSPFG
jgi:hypothetical protein